MRASHTTKAGRAKCLAYRNGKRCGRVARVVSGYGSHRQALCQECAARIGGQVLQESEAGFVVRSTSFGGIRREYVPVR